LEDKVAPELRTKKETQSEEEIQEQVDLLVGDNE